MILELAMMAFVTVVTPTEDRYQCVDPEGLVVAGGSTLTSTRNDCIVSSQLRPGQTYYLTRTETIVSTPEEPKEWLVAPQFRGTDRPVYACDALCLAEKKKGPSVGRSYPQGVGRCEGPLESVWGTSTRQWQYTTTPEGVRGLTYCKLMQPEAPDPSPVGWLASSCPNGAYVTWTPADSDTPANARLYVHETAYPAATQTVDVDMDYTGGICLNGLSPGVNYSVYMTSFSDQQESRPSNNLEIVVDQ